jgi:hypothetical protein
VVAERDRLKEWHPEESWDYGMLVEFLRRAESDIQMDEQNQTDPEFDPQEEHVWFEEITKQSSETSTIGYFDPDQPWKEAKAYWSKWWAMPASQTIHFVE